MKSYIQFLKEKIFKTEEYLQFNLLLKDLLKLKKYKCNHFGIIERSYLYDGLSIFSPIYNKKKIVTIFDYNFKNFNKNRIGAQKNWIGNYKFNFTESKYKIIDEIGKVKLNFKNIDCDIILIPNVVHHCSNFDELIKQIKIKFKKIKYIYIFDSPIRESHQYPYDFERQTPSSIDKIMKKYHFNKIYYNDIGNVFDVMLYIISQGRVILDKKENKNLSNQVNKLIPLLKNNRNKKKYQNLGRKHARMYSAYSMIYKLTN